MNKTALPHICFQFPFTSPVFTYLLIVIFSLPVLCNAQTLVEEGKQWNIQLTDFTPDATTFKLRIAEDTLIGGITYSKILRSQDNANTGWFPLDQYLRQDDSKKVYLKTGTDPEFVLYDFNLNKGDFIALSTQCGLAITQVDTITLPNGSMRKRLKVESSFIPEDEGDFWIDGIGSTKAGLLSHFAYHCQADYGETFLCHYNQNGELIYPESPPACFVSSIQQLAGDKQLKVYPNPTTESIFIEDKSGQNRLESISLFNVLGAEVFNQALPNLLSKIQLSHLPKGIYFLVLQTKSGLAFSQRVVKN